MTISLRSLPIILVALATFSVPAYAKFYTDIDRSKLCEELNKEITAEYAKMGISPEVLKLTIYYDIRKRNMQLFFSGTMLRNTTVEELRTSWLSRLKPDGVAGFKQMGFNSFVFYAKGKSCEYRLKK